MYFYGYYGFLLMLPVLILSSIIQIRLKSTYATYSRAGNSRNMTGADIARSILHGAGIYDVEVHCIGGT